jgi:hypothetical protein
MNSSLFFWVCVKFSSSVHGFGAVQPMFTKFGSLISCDLHQDFKLSSRIIHMHTKYFRKISQLVNFKLFPCHLSPPLKPAFRIFRKIIKWVILIQIQFRQLLWVLGGKRKRWEKIHLNIFGSINCDLSTSSPKSSNSNILVSTHRIGKMEIVLESLSSREEMVNFFFIFWVFHL